MTSRTSRSAYLGLQLLAAAAILAGCAGEDHSPSALEYPLTVIARDVIVVDDDPALRLHDISDDVLVLERLGNATVSEGALLVGSERGGYIRRARVVEADGNLLRIKAEPRFLMDAIISGCDDGRFTIGPGSAERADTLALVSGAGISLDGLVLCSAEDGSPAVTIERGSISFAPAVDIGIAFYGRSVTRFSVSVEGELGIDLDIRAELPSEVSHSGIFRVAALRQPAAMKIGSVPVPVMLELDICLDSVIEGSTTEPCTAAYEGRHTISAGMNYSGGWKETGPGAGLGFELPAMSIGPLSDCSIRVAVRAELRVSFYSADTAVFGIDPWISAGCEIVRFPVWRWSLAGGLSITRSFRPEMISRRMPAFEAIASADSVVLESGPYEAADYIFVREWEGAGSDRGGFDQPRGISAGPQGNIYVTDQNNHRVVVFDRLGAYLFEWGSYGSSAGMFLFPAGIAVAPDGSVFVADSGNHRIQRFTADGAWLGEWGSEGTGDGQFVQLEGIAAGPDSLLAVCDSGTSSFSIFTVSGSFIGRYPSLLARGAAFDGMSNIYTAGCRSEGITKTDREGLLLATLGPDLCVTDLAVDGEGNICVLDYDLDRLDILDPSGNVISSIGSSGSGPGEFHRPGGVAVSPEGWIYVADTANDRIQVFAPK